MRLNDFLVLALIVLVVAGPWLFAGSLQTPIYLSFIELALAIGMVAFNKQLKYHRLVITGLAAFIMFVALRIGMGITK